MPSKYASVFARLTKVLGTDPKHQERVDAVKDAMRTDKGFTCQGAILASEYAALRREMDDINEQKSELQVHLDAVTQLMEDQFEVEGVSSLSLSNGDKVRVEPAIHPQVVDPEAFRLWCLQDPDLSRKMALHPSTTASLVKQMLLDGRAEPPGTQAVVWNKVVFTRGEEF